MTGDDGWRVRRRWPRARELAPLLRFRRPVWDARTRRLARALTIADLRHIARRRTPRAAFDYADGAAEAEISIRRAVQAFEDVEFRPSVLRDVSSVTLEREVLGAPSAMPMAIAPTGFTRMLHTDGEIAGATAAQAAGIPYTLSTMGTASIEDVARVTSAGPARNWFQLYLWRDREKSMALVDRAAAAGFEALLVTVDVPVAGARLRDSRNGMTIPPTLTARTVLDAIPRAGWWFDFLSTEPLRFASFDEWGGTIGELINTMFDPTVTFEDLRWIRDRWPGTFVVKGVQTLDDAKLLTELGVDGVVLSNHGGRQLDRAPVPFHLLPAVVREVGRDTEVMIDTGIRSGADVIAAIAHGARSTLIGRAYLYGLMAGGRAGVDRALDILRTEMIRTMGLLGVTALDELRPAHVQQLSRLGPPAGP